MKVLASIGPILMMMFLSFNTPDKAANNLYPFEVQKTGSGNQSIIFIPGFACSGDVWNETKAKLEHDYTCYTLTMAGFAGVEPQDNPTFAGWEEGIANFIKNNQIKNPILVGHSMGGGLAMALAADYPYLIKKIVVVDALPCLSAMINPSFKPKENNDCSQIINQITKMSDIEFYQMQENTIRRLVADTTMQDTVLSWSLKSDKETFGKMYCDFTNTDLREKIKNIQCPSLIMLEPYFKNFKPAVTAQFMHLKDSDIQYADKGLHFIMFDDKDWYFNQLFKFIPLS